MCVCVGWAAGTSLCPTGLACRQLCSLCKSVAMAFCHLYWNARALQWTWTPGRPQCTHICLHRSPVEYLCLPSHLLVNNLFCVVSLQHGNIIPQSSNFTPWISNVFHPTEVSVPDNCRELGGLVFKCCLFSITTFFPWALWELIWHQWAFITIQSLLTVSWEAPLCSSCWRLSLWIFVILLWSYYKSFWIKACDEKA